MRVTPKAPGRTAEDIAAEVERRGIRLLVDDGRLRWHAPPGAMNVDLLREVKRQEPALTALLAANPQEGRR